MKCRRTPSSITIVMGLFLVLLATLLAIPNSLRAVQDAATPPAQRASAEIPDGAVGEYLFNEGTGNTIGDSSGYARNGENHGAMWISSPIRDANVQAGYALKFDATYVSVPSDALKHLPLTISLWASPEQNVNDHRNNIISNDRPSHSGHGIGVASNGGLWLEYEDVPGASFRNTSKALEWGKWYHLVAIYEEGRLRTYVDGQLVDDLAFRQAALDAQTTFLIGRHNFDSGLGNMVHYKGAIDAIRIYHRALTSDEISRLYQEGAPEPSGSLSSPPDNLSIGPATLPLSATVTNPTNFTVKNVEFVALYDGTWHSAGTDEVAPYQSSWQTPNILRSQQIKFGIHLNLTPERKILFSGGTRSVNYLEYLGNPGVAENWIPTRAYLNQRTLSPEGDSMCNVASMAMLLAMNGVISLDRASMVTKAEAMYPGVLATNGKPHLQGVVDELKRQGMTVEYPYLSADDAWDRLEAEIDAGRPVIVRTPATTLTSSGHYIVAVGYRDATGSRQIIVYDPYGRWNGTTDSYNANSKTDASSRRGQWVSYDFDLAFGKSYNLVIAQPKSGIMAALHATETPSTPPDSISDEPENDELYSGIQDIGAQVYLPFARR